MMRNFKLNPVKNWLIFCSVLQIFYFSTTNAQLASEINNHLINPYLKQSISSSDFFEHHRGPRGPRGARGPQGVRGLRGLPGINGEPGAAGVTGATGATGATGSLPTGSGTARGNGSGEIILPNDIIPVAPGSGFTSSRGVVSYDANFFTVSETGSYLISYGYNAESGNVGLITFPSLGQSVLLSELSIATPNTPVSTTMILNLTANDSLALYNKGDTNITLFSPNDNEASIFFNIVFLGP